MSEINEKFNPADLISALNSVNPDPSYTNELSPPLQEEAERILLSVKRLMFSRLLNPDAVDSDEEINLAQRIFTLFKDYLKRYFTPARSEELAAEIMSRLPRVKLDLIQDAVAIYDGDPAARSVEEIMLCYPGFIATTVYRIAHMLYQKNIPYLPRMMTEYAHRMTGIDIHPGAVIGAQLCIDHGTGIVIGETAEIGDRVKIYQGVTVGAKSFASDGSGRLIKGGKRHPTIGNDCIIYAGATILGGDTVIGDGSVIGGNVWLTHSVPPASRVYYNEGGTVYIKGN